MLSSTELDQLRLRLEAFRPEYALGGDKWAFRCCELALKALLRGDYGVAAVLLDGEGECLGEACNRVFSQGFDSSAHAEMRLLDDFERNYPDYKDRDQLTLLVSLEPCPMCCSRILSAGIGHVRYLVKDVDGGMMSQCSKLPAAWRNLSQISSIAVSNADYELRSLALDIASAQQSDLRKKLMAIIRP